MLSSNVERLVGAAAFFATIAFVAAIIGGAFH